jgi:propanol-preferring alcohol dehydrogenase
MRAMLLQQVGAMRADRDPLVAADLPMPEPAPGEIRVRVEACGVCHTELDEIEGRTPPRVLPVVPGHEIVGIVDALGADASLHSLGNRVGVGWIHHSSGTTDENLSPEFTATGRDVNGGYAEYMTVPEDYAFPIPERYESAQAAPLLCAGAVGYRALKLTRLRDGEALGFMGFGASAHLMLQLARHMYPHSRLCVFARDAAQRQFALTLGADWAGATQERSPFELDAIVDTTPAWLPVVEALANLAPGGRLVINAIRKESDDKHLLGSISYRRQLWLEREIKTVANVTRFDIAAFLPLAAGVPLLPEVTCYPLHQANRALLDLRFGQSRGAKVLTLSGQGA